MTCRFHDTLIIVFGAGGRLGRTLLAMLASGPWVVVAVARSERPAVSTTDVHWVQIDVTETDVWERSLQMLCGAAARYDNVFIVDLLLDKTTVTAMRRSLVAGTSYIARLHSRLADAGCLDSLVLASTSAVLAPRLYQTPYGLAKRRQLAQYVSSGLPGRALLLPSLVDAELDRPTTSDRLVWTYTEAATRIAQAVTSARASKPTGLRLIAPRVDRSPRLTARVSRPQDLRILAQVLRLHVVSWTTQRDSPQAHHLASRGLLDLTPRWLRHRVDHHILPAGLLYQLARKLGTEIAEKQR